MSKSLCFLAALVAFIPAAQASEDSPTILRSSTPPKCDECPAGLPPGSKPKGRTATATKPPQTTPSAPKPDPVATPEPTPTNEGGVAGPWFTVSPQVTIVNNIGIDEAKVREISREEAKIGDDIERAIRPHALNHDDSDMTGVFLGVLLGGSAGVWTLAPGLMGERENLLAATPEIGAHLQLGGFASDEFAVAINGTWGRGSLRSDTYKVSLEAGPMLSNRAGFGIRGFGVLRQLGVDQAMQFQGQSWGGGLGFFGSVWLGRPGVMAAQIRFVGDVEAVRAINATSGIGQTGVTPTFSVQLIAGGRSGKKTARAEVRERVLRDEQTAAEEINPETQQAISAALPSGETATSDQPTPTERTTLNVVVRKSE